MSRNIHKDTALAIRLYGDVESLRFQADVKEHHLHKVLTRRIDMDWFLTATGADTDRHKQKRDEYINADLLPKEEP
jgi:hypothetical protein